MTITALVALAAPSLASAAVETLVLRSQAFPMKPYQVVQGMTAVPSPRVDGYVTGMTVEVVDSAGRVQTMNDVMLHHAVFVKALVPDYTCGRFYDYDRRPSPLPAERFFGAGEEHMELHLPDGYGYANRGTDIWGLVYMLMNHRNAASTVHVQYRIQYVTGEPRTPVKPVWLDVVNCYADPIFTVPVQAVPARASCARRISRCRRAVASSRAARTSTAAANGSSSATRPARPASSSRRGPAGPSTTRCR